jgi:hypothetical protein
MAELRITANIPEVVRSLNDLAFKQVPFATSLALNRVGKTARADQTEGIFERFNVRESGFIKKSVRMRAAKKSDLRVELSIRDAFLIQHDGGGVRLPGDIYSSIVQPIEPGRGGIGAARGQKLRGRTTPRAVLRNRRAFVERTKRGKLGVFLSVGKGKDAVDQLLFTFEPEQKLTKDRLQFEGTVTSSVARNWEREFGAALAQAIASAR